MRAARRWLAAGGVAMLGLAGCSFGDDGPDRPEFSAPVVDEADVVPDAVEQRVNEGLKAFEARYGPQIAVAVVESTGDTSIEDYTIDLARDWGVGDKDRDDGVLLLIAYEDRQLRIEVGDGVEGDLTDLESGRILGEMRSFLRAGDVGGAVEQGVLAIRAQLGDDAASPLPAPPAPSDSDGGSGDGFPWPLLFFLLPAMGFGFFRRSGLGGRRRGWGSPILWGGGFGGGFGGGGWSGGGGGGGGWGGGGGGGFSGGGASGNW